MITLLTGENSYEVEQALGQIVTAFDGEPEKFDGDDLELRQLPDLLMGMSLFSEKRLVIIRGLAGNKQVWDALPDLIERMNEDIHVVLVETSVDKRTKTYKSLQKTADVKEFQLWSERDSRQAERWVMDEAKRMGMALDAAAARLLIKRCFVLSAKGQPVVDQWQARHALEKLSVLDDVTPEAVEEYIDEQPVDTVFAVFETALKGDEAKLHRLLEDIEPKEDPFRAFGLISGQVFQLAALHSSDAPSAEVAKAIGAHPFAISKLTPFAKKFSSRDIRQITAAFKEADEAMKLSKAGPWVLIEQALTKVALTVNSK